MTAPHDLPGITLEGFDSAWQPFLDRIAGMTDDEYHWLPVANSWTVRRNEAGVWLADWEDPDPDPAPVTSIAWRCWHIADALDSYSARVFGRTGNGLPELHWVADWPQAHAALVAAGDVFRAGIIGWGADLFDTLGAEWGPFGDHTRLSLVLHASREVIHHGAEVALLRDLYAAR